MNNTIDIYDDKDIIAHYGVEGMKWGVRRYQPYPPGHKGGKVIGEAAKKTASRAKEAANNAKRNAVKKAAIAKNNRKQERSEAKAVGKSVKEYRKDKAATKAREELRTKTLNETSNPNEIAKGMHTLSDIEIKQKLNRLENEEKIRNIASRYPKTGKERVKKTIKDSAWKQGTKELEKALSDPTGYTRRIENFAKQFALSNGVSSAAADQSANIAGYIQGNFKDYSRYNPRYTSR